MAIARGKIAERKRTAAAMITVWDSLQSHLDYAAKEPTAKEKGLATGGRKFHADCVREYAKIIHDLSQNL